MSSIASNRCVYNGCQNTRKRTANLSFYRFPTKDKTRCKEWVINSGNTKLKVLDSNALQYRLICELHFTANNFRDASAPKKSLTWNAVPLNFNYRGCADENQASEKNTFHNSALSSSDNQPIKTEIKTYSRKRPTFSAANIKGKRSQDICRTCLRTIYVEEAPFYHVNDTTSLESNSFDTIKQKFAACIPEVDLQIIADAQICGYCAAALHWAYEFRKNCLKTEEMIYDFLKEIGGDMYNIDWNHLLKWINLKTLQKLKSVEIVSDIASSDWGAEEICINNDSDTDLSNVTDEIEIKEETLFDEHEMLKIVKLEEREVTNAVGQCDIKIEETKVKEPISVETRKLIIENDERVTENITKIHKVENPPMQNIANLHTCMICQTSFSLKCDLRLHVILHTNNTPPFECDVCQFISPDKIILRRHLNSHIKELEFKCKACKASVNDLDDHDAETCMIDKLYGVSAAKKFRLEESIECSYQCGNSVGSTPLICKKINKIDMNYMCNVCRESFTEKVHLMQHLNNHVPFKKAIT